MFPLNFSFSSRITKDKTWTNKILKEKKFRTIKGEHFFLNSKHIDYRKGKRELSDALSYAKDKYPVFVKPNDSSSGLYAEVIYDENSLVKHLVKIEKISEIGIIQEVKNFDEYRIFAIDGKVQFVYRRESVFLYGDGVKSARILLEEINSRIIKKKNKIFEKDIYLKKVFSDNKLKFSSILSRGEKIYISSKANLSAGGFVRDYKKRVSKEVEKWVFELMKIFSLRICGIDIFVDGSINNPNDFIVIEVNSNPSLTGIYKEGYNKDVLKIWNKIFKKYFLN
jgi:D-alanine-D-alanine ligase-like ATP-grasp enzyme